MTNTKFREIRERLGFTQAELASFLEYGSPVRISEFERATNPRPVPRLLAIVMQALDDGYRPADWPSSGAP
ncbi:helix-turn-helix domain-containing protein [Shinella sp.]|uniref:helix-turn-helix domain-containing protein n=1 Tax=Shinella sp. TaxID=1870904 RepID=UPI0028AF7CCB|nr:helix-turn-helix domain-containing protein [Shinella sp.]